MLRQTENCFRYDKYNYIAILLEIMSLKLYIIFLEWVSNIYNRHLLITHHEALSLTSFSKENFELFLILTTARCPFVRAFSNLSRRGRHFKIKQTFTVNDVDISLDSSLRLSPVNIQTPGESKGSPAGVSAFLEMQKGVARTGAKDEWTNAGGKGESGD